MNTTQPGRITRDKLLTLEAYAKLRKSSKPDAIAHRRLRTVALGEHVTLQFEDEKTVLRQIQEMLHIEKIFDEEGIQSEIDAYAPLVPDGSNWKATMLIEYPDPHERKRELARLIDIEDRMFVEVEGQARVYAIADEDLDRENEEKTSAVHFVRFEFPLASRQAVLAGAAVKLGCDHRNYPAHVELKAETLAALAGDLRA
jgi:recombination DNA repair RAD52 pathway protein